MTELTPEQRKRLERSERARQGWAKRKARMEESYKKADKQEPQSPTQPGPSKENEEGPTNPYVEPPQELPQKDPKEDGDKAAAIAALESEVAEARIAALEAQLAELKGEKKAEAPKLVSLPDDSAVVLPDGGEDADIVVHFVADGFTSNGKMWYRGEEFRVTRGSDAHKATIDRNGNSWLDLTKEEQIERYEKVMFKPGPWPYEKPSIEQMAADYEEYANLVAAGDAEAVRRYEKRKQREASVSVGV